MGRRNIIWTPQLIERRIAEGRGQGEGADYKPWFTVHDVKSRGRSHLIKGWKHGRVHHLLSDLELKIFLLYNFSPFVFDIREQYPLPLRITLAIAEALGIKHPKDPRTNQLIPLTTDLFLTVKIGFKTVYIARTVKYSKDLLKPRVLEKLEIERRYWKSVGVSWAVVTELEISKQLILNLQWVHPYYWLADLYPLSADEVNQVSQVLTRRVLDNTTPLREITRACDAKLGLEIGWSLAVVRHLIANRYWQVDLNIPIRTSERIKLLNIPGIHIH